MAKIRAEKYQHKLLDAIESADKIDSSYTVFYNGFYIHGANYDGVHIVRVRLIGCAFYYSTSLSEVKKKIRAFRRAFRL